MKDCAVAYSARECEATERARLEALARHLNTSTVPNLDFKKANVPNLGISKEILAFWEENKDTVALLENWPRGNTYVNEVRAYFTLIFNCSCALRFIQIILCDGLHMSIVMMARLTTSRFNPVKWPSTKITQRSMADRSHSVEITS